MVMLAEVSSTNALTIGAIVVGAVIAFWIVHRIVKFVLSLVIVALIAAAAVFYCVKAGYLSMEDAEKLNPLNNEQIRQTAKDAGAWAGAQAKEVARKAVDAAVNEAVDRAIPTNAPAK